MENEILGGNLSSPSNVRDDIEFNATGLVIIGPSPGIFSTPLVRSNALGLIGNSSRPRYFFQPANWFKNTQSTTLKNVPKPAPVPVMVSPLQFLGLPK